MEPRLEKSPKLLLVLIGTNQFLCLRKGVVAGGQEHQRRNRNMENRAQHVCKSVWTKQGSMRLAKREAAVQGIGSLMKRFLVQFSSRVFLRLEMMVVDTGPTTGSRY